MLKTGIECEGVYSNLETLFVGSNVSLEQLEKIMVEARYSHVYFGADYAEVDWKMVSFALSLQDRINRNTPITVELPAEEEQLAKVPLTLSYKVHIMLRFRFVSSKVPSLKMFPNLQVKVETDRECHVAPLGSMLTNSKNYLDKPIEQ